MPVLLKIVERPGERLACPAGKLEGSAWRLRLERPEALPGRSDPQQRLQSSAGCPQRPQGEQTVSEKALLVLGTLPGQAKGPNSWTDLPNVEPRLCPLHWLLSNGPGASRALTRSCSSSGRSLVHFLRQLISTHIRHPENIASQPLHLRRATPSGLVTTSVYAGLPPGVPALWGARQAGGDRQQEAARHHGPPAAPGQGRDAAGGADRLCTGCGQR